MNLFDKLVTALKQISPNVKQTTIEKDQFVKEFSENPTFISHQIENYKVIALELWKILDDIEKAELLTPNDTLAYRSIVKELSKKRFVYLKESEIPSLEKKVKEIVKKENEA